MSAISNQLSACSIDLARPVSSPITLSLSSQHPPVIRSQAGLCMRTLLPLSSPVTHYPLARGTGSFPRPLAVARSSRNDRKEIFWILVLRIITLSLAFFASLRENALVYRSLNSSAASVARTSSSARACQLSSLEVGQCLLDRPRRSGVHLYPGSGQALICIWPNAPGDDHGCPFLGDCLCRLHSRPMCSGDVRYRLQHRRT